MGLAVDAGATSEAAAACGTAVGLLDELFPAVLAALRHDDDAAAMTVVPFLQVSLFVFKPANMGEYYRLNPMRLVTLSDERQSRCCLCMGRPYVRRSDPSVHCNLCGA